MSHAFHTRTALADGLRALFKQLDLAVRKIARFVDNYKEDVTGQALLNLNLRNAVALAREVESER